MPQLAIIIPGIGDAEKFEKGLVSVLQHAPECAEVLLVLPQPYADPYQLHEELTLLPVKRKSTYAACLAAGLAASESEFVHFLAPGWEVGEDWVEAALARFSSPQIASVIPHVKEEQDPRQTCSVGVRYSWGGARRVCRKQGQSVLGPELTAAFYRRSALEQIGGVPQNLGSRYADVDMALALKQQGYRAELATDSQIVAVRETDLVQGGFCEGLYAERMFWRNTGSVGWFRSLVAHPFAVAGQTLEQKKVVKMATHLAGHLLGLCSLGSSLRYQRSEQLRREQAVSTPAANVRENSVADRVEKSQRQSEFVFRIDSAHKSATAATENKAVAHSRHAKAS